MHAWTGDNRPHDTGEWDRGFILTGFVVASLATLAWMLHDHIRPVDVVIASLISLAIGGALLVLWPALDETLADAPMGQLVAFVGCDGSGKSTLTGDLHSALAEALPVRICYLGLGSGAMGERIKQLPLAGPAIERRLSRKAAQSRSREGKIPGLATALVIYGFSLVRLRRFKRMLRLRRQGYVVLTDRYPQTEFPGLYDGPGLSAAAAGSWIVATLARYERRIYGWMASFRPDMIVRLNVDAATALARKPEHRADLVERKVKITPQLRFAGARIVDLDATRPYVEVRRRAARIVGDVVGLAAAKAA